MKLHADVAEALRNAPDDWRKTLALTLAAEIEAVPNASMARELRSVMAAIDETLVPDEVTTVDDLRSRRASRIAGAAS